jgi:hypothetical protein
MRRSHRLRVAVARGLGLGLVVGSLAAGIRLLQSLRHRR